MDIDFDKAFAEKKLPTFQDAVAEHVVNVLKNGYHYAQTTVDAVYAYIQLRGDGTSDARVFFRIRGEYYAPADLNSSPLKKRFDVSEEQQTRLSGYIADELALLQKLYSSGTYIMPSEIWSFVEPRADIERTQLGYRFDSTIELPPVEAAVAKWQEELRFPEPDFFGPVRPPKVELDD